MPRIHQLDAGVINKIAAGEVIERPASVVKELLENSIDALSTRIEVDVAQGGADLIRIVDDGEGIHPDDILLSVNSHATSKITSADDLFEVQTMGFRGEALASIAEVSQFRLRSRQADAIAGVELEVNCGRIAKPQPCGCPTGTLIEIRQLFANTPVRRKFMKTTATEFGHISEHFTRIALANPRLHMVLRHNQKTVYELPATNKLIDRLSLFYGSELAEKLIWVESETDGIRMWGYVAHPSHSKSTRKGQHLFLNGRWIQDRSLQHALTEAYRGILMVGRQPVSFLFLEVPASHVDVNVHPTKVEVRFRDSQQLYRQLLAMLRTKFLGMDLDSDFRLRQDSAEKPQPAGASKHQRELQMELSAWSARQTSSSSLRPPDTVGSPSTFAPSSPANSATPDWQQPAGGLDTRPAAGTGFNRTESRPWRDDGARGTSSPISDNQLDRPVDALQHEGDDQASSPADASLALESQQPETTPALPDIARAMQIHDCYLVVETAEGMTVIDQHALHERVMYEYLRTRVLDGSVEAQRLLVPTTIEMSPKEAALLVENKEILEQLGFGIEEFGQNTILLNRYPVMLAKANLVQLVRDITEQLDRPEKKPTRRDILDELLHMMSCKAAIKSGDRLTDEEIQCLLAQRHLIDDAHHCPHGRPTALVLSQSELDRQFGRLG